MQTGLQSAQTVPNKGNRQHHGGTRRRDSHDGQLQMANQEERPVLRNPGSHFIVLSALHRGCGLLVNINLSRVLVQITPLIEGKIYSGATISK